MSDVRDAARRVIQSTSYRSGPLPGIREGDIGVLVGTPIVTALGFSIVADALVIPGLLLGVVLGALVTYVTPSHQNARSWLQAVLRYVRRQPVTVQGPRGRTTPGRSHPFVLEEDTAELTSVTRAYPDAAAVQRSDGTVRAYLELKPGNMDFAMSDDWANVQSAATAFVNDDLTFPLTMYATTRAFPTERLVNDLTQRLSDPDVSENERLTELIESYIDSRPAEIDSRGARDVRYYLGVEVSELDALDRYDRERTPVEKLARIPLLGICITPLLSRRDGRSDEELRNAQLRLLDERIRLVRHELVDAIDGWSERRLDTEELLFLEFEYWNGTHDGVDRATLVQNNTPLENYPRGNPDDHEQQCSAENSDQSSSGTIEPPATERTDDEFTDQRRVLAPDGVEWQTRSARVDEMWVSALSITGYPDYPKDGYLSALFDRADVSFDLSARFEPTAQERAKRDLRETADDLRVDTELERTSRGAHLGKLASDATAAYTAVEDGARVFEQSITLVVRADSEEELERARSEVQRALRDAPANLVPKPVICRQDLALRSAAPFGRNELDRTVSALGGAVGALLASPHESTLLEPGGVEVGVNRENGSPLVIDPFARDNGYATFTVGDTGSGKSFGAKQQFLRSIQRCDDRIGIILEPLNNWAGVADALDAEQITIGGKRGLNPLEIRETPSAVTDAMGPDASPFAEKVDDVLSFFTNFFALRDIELGDRRPTLELAVLETYERSGITGDLGTHGRESPTITDLLDVLADIVDSPDEYTVRSTIETGHVEADAGWLLSQLRPFSEDGRYENLGRESEFDLGESSVVYLDLGQQEGSQGGSGALTMQLLISLAYERAKESSKEVVFVIDEARYLMRNSAHLGYLETVIRHHRHHDLSLRLVTQTVDEFFERPEGEAIIDQCAIKQFHRLDGMDDQWAEEFGMNHAQKRFVQTAQPGSETTGYSEALIEVDGEWRGIEVRATEAERRVIDADADG